MNHCSFNHNETQPKIVKQDNLNYKMKILIKYEIGYTSYTRRGVLPAQKGGTPESRMNNITPALQISTSGP